MNEEQVLDIFRACGALLEGHFQLTSGRHSGRYMQCAQVLQYPQHAETLCRALVRLLRFYEATTVVAPALGGVIVGYEIARQLGARSLFSERAAGGQMLLRRGFQLLPGENVLVVEDVCTTGGSIREVIGLATAAGAQVAAIAALVDRSDGAADFGRPFHSLVQLDIPSYPADACPLCSQGTPAVKPGSRN